MPLDRQATSSGGQGGRRRSSRRGIRTPGRAAQPRGDPPAGLPGQTRLKIRYQGPIKAPIAKGQHVADLVVYTDDTSPQVVPLVAGEAIDQAGFFGRIWLGFKQLVGMA